jgi:hypothetical protein
VRRALRRASNADHPVLLTFVEAVIEGCKRSLYPVPDDILSSIRILESTMNTKKIHALTLMVISFTVIGAIQFLLYEAMIIIEQARSGSIPYQLSAEILFVVLIHASIVAAIPLLLVVRDKHITSYIFLLVFLSIYAQVVAAINIAGVVISVLILFVLIFYVIKKLSFVISYFRSK